MKQFSLLCLFVISTSIIQAQTDYNTYINFGMNHTSLQLKPQYNSSMAGSMTSTAIIDNYGFYPMPTLGMGFNINRLKLKTSLEVNLTYARGNSDYYYYYYGKERNGQMFYRFFNISLQPTLTIPIYKKFSMKTGISINGLINSGSYFEGRRTHYYNIHNQPFDEPIVTEQTVDWSLPSLNAGFMIGFIYQLNKQIGFYLNYDVRVSQIYSNDVYPPQSIKIQAANIGLNYAFHNL